jgi:hypothetical protein
MDDSIDEVEARIRALGQVRLSAGAQEATEALGVMLEDPEVRATVKPQRRRGFRGLSRKRRILVGSLIALAGMGVGVAVPAVALTSWLARTGQFGDPKTSTEVDKSEWISLGASDAPQVVVDAFPGYLTLPVGVPKDAAIGAVSHLFAKMSADAGGQARAQEGLMRQTYELFAICAWTGDWLAADTSSDEARMNTAATWLGDTQNFPASMTNNAGGYADALLGWAAGARAGDRTTVEKAYTMQTCDAFKARGQQ